MHLASSMFGWSDIAHSHSVKITTGHYRNHMHNSRWSHNHHQQQSIITTNKGNKDKSKNKKRNDASTNNHNTVRPRQVLLLVMGNHPLQYSLNYQRSVAKLSSPLAGNLMSWSLVIQNSSTYLDFTMASSTGPTRKQSTGQSADATEMQGRIIVIVLPWPWIMRAVIDQPHLQLRIAWLVKSNTG